MPFVLLLIAQALFGAWGVAARALPLSGPALVALMAAGGLLFVRVTTPGPAFPIPRKSLWVGISLCVDTLLLIAAYRGLPFAVAIALHYLGPLIVQAAAPWLLRETPDRRQIMLACTGFAGGVLAAGPSRFIETHALAIAAALASAVTLAGNIILQKRRMTDDPDPGRAVGQYNMVLGLAAAAVLAACGGLPELLAQKPSVWLEALLAGVLIQGVALAFFNHALVSLRGTVTAVVSTTEIPFAILFGALLYGQHLTAYQWMGVALVGLSVAGLKRGDAIATSETRIPREAPSLAGRTPP